MLRRLNAEQQRSVRHWAMEFVVVVAGVLLALLLQQVVETMQTHQRIKETRAALDVELSRNLAAFEWRVNQRGCLRSRVDELDRWATAMAAGQPLALKKEITLPRYFALNQTVWQASANDAGQMSVETKLSYANMYAALGTLGTEVWRDEQQAWDSISGYEQNKDLTREELHTVRSAINDLQSDDALLDVFQQRLHSQAAKLGIRPLNHIETGIEAQVTQNNRELCEPLL
jgi:hypothetical protein